MLSFPGTFLPYCGVRVVTSRLHCMVNLVEWAHLTPVESGSTYPCRMGPLQPLTSLSQWGTIEQEVIHLIKIYVFFNNVLLWSVTPVWNKLGRRWLIGSLLLCQTKMSHIVLLYIGGYFLCFSGLAVPDSFSWSRFRHRACHMLYVLKKPLGPWLYK